MGRRREREPAMGRGVVGPVKRFSILLFRGGDVYQQAYFGMVLERDIKPRLFQRGPPSESDRWV